MKLVKEKLESSESQIKSLSALKNDIESKLRIYQENSGDKENQLVQLEYKKREEAEQLLAESKQVTIFLYSHSKDLG